MRDTQLAPAINAVGCGKLGKTLLAAWHKSGLVCIGDIVNRSLTSAEASAAFIEAGRAKAQLEQVTPADIWLLGVTDTQLPNVVTQLTQLNQEWAGTLIFHCSGAGSADILQPLAARGAATASVHPVHSFANPTASLQTMQGCFAVAEGQPQALTRLMPLFEGVGFIWREIQGPHKLLYHAASVFACNYLVTLLDHADQCLSASGENLTLEILAPLIRQTLNNTVNEGPQNALTGPIARGDVNLVDAQLQALNNFDPRIAQTYQALAVSTLPLANTLMDNPDRLDQFIQLLSTARER